MTTKNESTWKKKVKENRKNKDCTRGKYLDNKKLDAWNSDTRKKVMFSVCNDARNNAEVSPQIYNAWGITCMGVLLYHKLSTILLFH